MKITYSQMHTYADKQRMPTLQELADDLCEDEEMEYVVLESKTTASLNKITVGNQKSIFTKIKKYPYEFEINSSLQLASIDGIQIADNTKTDTVSKADYDQLASLVATLSQKVTALENNQSQSQNPTGTIIAYSVDSVPTGYLKCDGQAVSRTDYCALFEIIGTTYGSGDGSTTFNLPNLEGKFLKGSSRVGAYESAGLPNITGTLLDLPSQSGSGVFTKNVSNVYAPAGSGGAYFGKLTFDASNSNSIYGNSTTVTPENMSVLYCIKY